MFLTVRTSVRRPHGSNIKSESIKEGAIEGMKGMSGE